MKQSRLKTVWTFGIMIALLTGYSMFKEMSEVAVIGIASLSGIIAKYNHDETKRPSKKAD